MRLQTAIRIICSEDDDQLERELDIQRVIDDTVPTTYDRKTFNLAALASNVQYVWSTEITNARYIIVQVEEGAVSVKLNLTTNVAIGIEVNPALSPDVVSEYQKVDQPGLLFLGPIPADTPITTLYLSNLNPTPATARVKVAVLGEAA